MNCPVYHLTAKFTIGLTLCAIYTATFVISGVITRKERLGTGSTESYAVVNTPEKQRLYKNCVITLMDRVDDVFGPFQPEIPCR